MIAYVALCLIVLIALAYGWWTHDLLRRREHAHDRAAAIAERRERDLLNRIMFLADRTWEVPDIPAPDLAREDEDEDWHFPENELIDVTEVL